MEFHNTYQDTTRAAAYDELELGGTSISETCLQRM